MCQPDKDDNSEIIRVEMKDEDFIRRLLDDNLLQKLKDINWNHDGITLTFDEIYVLFLASQLLPELKFIRANS